MRQGLVARVEAFISLSPALICSSLGLAIKRTGAGKAGAGVLLPG